MAMDIGLKVLARLWYKYTKWVGISGLGIHERSGLERVEKIRRVNKRLSHA